MKETKEPLAKFHAKLDPKGRVLKKLLALGMVYEDRGMYKLSERFSERMENLAKMWKFEIGKVAELW